MKKILSLCIFTALSCNVLNAQTIRQIELKSDNNLNYLYYNYNENNRVDSIYQEIASDNYSSYRLFQYDKNGNNTRVERYQMSKDMNDYMFTDYVNFTYDENNNILTRINYNLDLWSGSNSFILGGVYIYEYDANNKLIKRSLYWDEELTSLYETIVYKYNDKGQLIEDTRSSDQFGMVLEDFKQVYEYDEKDRLSKITFFTLDYSSGKLAENSYRTYQYNEDGNMIEELDILLDQAINEKHLYTYNTDIESVNAIFPINNDDANPLYYASKNVIAENNIYMRDIKTGNLVYIDKEIWVYEEYDPAGISEISSVPEANITLLTSNKLELGNVSSIENIRIFNEAGCLVKNTSYGDGINISDLSKGVYMIVTKNNSFKIRK